MDLHGGGIRGAEQDIVSVAVHKWVKDIKESLGDAAISSLFFFSDLPLFLMPGRQPCQPPPGLLS